MNTSDRFIRRPIATSLMAGALLVVGLIAFLRLPVSALPQVDFPTIQVSAALARRQPRDHGLQRRRHACSSVSCR